MFNGKFSNKKLNELFECPYPPAILSTAYCQPMGFRPTFGLINIKPLLMGIDFRKISKYTCEMFAVIFVVERVAGTELKGL